MGLRIVYAVHCVRSLFSNFDLITISILFCLVSQSLFLDLFILHRIVIIDILLGLLSLFHRSATVKSEMGRVSRVEPNDRILVDTSDSLRLRLQQIGWYEFIRKFHGYNI